MRIAVLGAGYVGLVTGACLASMGHEVHIFEVDEAKLALLRGGTVPIHEPGLEELFAEAATPVQFRSMDEGREHFDAYYIAVGTPRGFNGNADLSYVRSAAAWICRKQDLTRPSLAIIKSTVPPGTAEIVRSIFRTGPVEVSDPEFPVVVSNPEFLKEGTAIRDFMHPDRIIVGFSTKDRHMADHFAAIYESLDTQMLVMSNESAELAKYASNGMLATRISFMNEMARISFAVGANIDDVKRAVAADSRIGTKFLNAGPGWGGSCFPKDLQALANMAEDDLPVVEGASRTNRIQMTHIAERCLRLLGHPARGSKCTIWGAAFKPDTDDTRSSPIRTIASILTAREVLVKFHDPIARLSDARLGEQVDDMYDAAWGADLVVLLTDWRDYLDADWAKLAGAMNRGVIFDTRNALDPARVPAELELVRL